MLALPNHVPSREQTGVDVALGAVAYWYLTGLLAALGLSLGLSLLRPAAGMPANRGWLETFTQADGRWYKQIATDGYQYDPDDRSNVAFFPVYPLLGRALMAVTGLLPEAALLVVSNLSLLAALVILALYVRGRYPNAPAELADYTLLAAALFPTGCFFRFAYSESTCVLLMLIAMYAMLRRWPLWVIAVIAGLVTAARPVGVALVVPFVIHVCRRAAARPRRTLLPLALYLPLACWGIGAFMAYQFFAFDDALAAFKVQDHCRIRASTNVGEKLQALLVFEPLRAVYDEADPGPYWPTWQPHALPWFSLQFANPIFFAVAVGLTALGAWRRWISLEETSLASLMLLIPYSGRGYEMGMASMGRFVAAVFPIYLVLGQLLVRLPGPLRALLLALSAFFLAIYTGLYAAGYLIF